MKVRIDTERCILVSSIILFCTLFCNSTHIEKLNYISAIENDIGRIDLVIFLSNNLEITYDELIYRLENIVDSYQVIDYLIDLMITTSK